MKKKRRVFSVLLTLAMCMAMSVPTFAVEIDEVAYASLPEDELAYCNLELAPENWKGQILEARDAIIHEASWTVDGQCAVQHADGTIEELPEFSELFPEWDVPDVETKAVINPRSVNSVNYVGYVYLRHPGTETTNPFRKLQ